MDRGSFIRHKRVKVSYADLPTERDRVWLDPVTGIQFSYDPTRDIWLSSSKDTLAFARNGNASGMYLPLLGDLYDTEDVYLSPYASVITGIWCRSKGGEESKSFDLRINREAVFTFSYDGSENRVYVNNDLSINTDAQDEINIFVSKELGTVKNTVCKVEITRRYVV